MNRTVDQIGDARTTRRDLLLGSSGLLAHAILAPTFAGAVALSSRTSPDKQSATVSKNNDVFYGNETLPIGIRSRLVDNNNGVIMHILEAGHEEPGRPCAVLVHGFPELAYTWRHQLLPLAQAGFHVIAPDLRGYGRSAQAPVTFDDDLSTYSVLNRVADVLGLVRALGHEKVAAIIGHDWGGPVVQWCARVRPDVFQSVVSMSTPFLRTPTLPLGTANKKNTPTIEVHIDKELAALSRPRKHYSSYSASRGVNENMWRAPQGVHDLLRALYYFKSADWKGNKPFPLKSWAATELAKMPTYYIMDLNQGAAETMAAAMPSKAEIDACKWMTEADLRVYSTEFIRTGFQGGLNYYRVAEHPVLNRELRSFSGRTIDVPACYIGGDREWAVYQSPGAFEAMHTVCTRLRGVHLVAAAGHSIPEEQPAEVNRLLIEFAKSV